MESQYLVRIKCFIAFFAICVILLTACLNTKKPYNSDIDCFKIYESSWEDTTGIYSKLPFTGYCMLVFEGNFKEKVEIEHNNKLIYKGILETDNLLEVVKTPFKIIDIKPNAKNNNIKILWSDSCFISFYIEYGFRFYYVNIDNINKNVSIEYSNNKREYK